MLVERPAEMNDKIKSLTEPFENPNKTWYEANCHCGAVKFKVRIPSLANVEVNCCDCFICSRNGYLLVYPSKEDVVFHTGYDHLKSYGFGGLPINQCYLVSLCLFQVIRMRLIYSVQTMDHRFSLTLAPWVEKMCWQSMYIT